jgi:hypothetical protein
LLVAGFVAWSWIAPKAPHDQSVDVLLGDRAPEVEDLTVRYTQSDREPARQVAFHWTHGAAPRVVHHAPRLPDGEYGVDIELGGSHGFSSVHRSVKLEEGRSTQIHAEEAK